MQAAGGPGWKIQFEMPSSISFVLWVRARLSELGSWPEAAWDDWFARVVEAMPLELPEIVRLTDDQSLRRAAEQFWTPFLKDWDQRKRQLVQRHLLAVQGAHLEDMMADTDVQLCFLLTNHPGDLCRKCERGWVLGAAYLDPAALRRLVSDLRGNTS